MSPRPARCGDYWLASPCFALQNAERSVSICRQPTEGRHSRDTIDQRLKGKQKGRLRSAAYGYNPRACG